MDLVEQDAYLKCMDDDSCAFDDDWNHIFKLYKVLLYIRRHDLVLSINS